MLSHRPFEPIEWMDLKVLSLKIALAFAKQDSDMHFLCTLTVFSLLQVMHAVLRPNPASIQRTHLCLPLDLVAFPPSVLLFRAGEVAYIMPSVGIMHLCGQNPGD